MNYAYKVSVLSDLFDGKQPREVIDCHVSTIDGLSSIGFLLGSQVLESCF